MDESSLFFTILIPFRTLQGTYLIPKLLKKIKLTGYLLGLSVMIRKEIYWIKNYGFVEFVSIPTESFLIVKR